MFIGSSNKWNANKAGDSFSSAEGNGTDMSGSCRRSLDVFAYDVRMANTVSASSNSIFFTFEDFNSGTESVPNPYDAAAKTHTGTRDGVLRDLPEDVENFGFSYFDLNRVATIDALSSQGSENKGCPPHGGSQRSQHR